MSDPWQGNHQLIFSFRFQAQDDDLNAVAYVTAPANAFLKVYLPCNHQKGQSLRVVQLAIMSSSIVPLHTSASALVVSHLSESPMARLF